ncbi:cytidine deaminase [Metschnikowia bicuspidata var. bicuspidata NRRL YB-4993]|uniref:Cytidine deaminase n=1 Tax=Metschnikowia bicuspidata var. bicuspidata NRRL YB-4993 TaxID=869754 RepID=A0A1A0H908_9ASCO|nr:cytidine deaminase [Metschnikowia bicuspidata var. bicuspidata NRRL YB-4993]OBA20609.1 cytidine deaminase [Metschnikowia bicuspidata var. bicuspidata NRRL YB-4993]
MVCSISVDEVATLVAAAQNARELSYSPYSRFRVGCAILTSSNKIIKGANVENASYGAAICAERTAIARAVMEGHTAFRALAISSDQKDPISPCGICRQSIREFGTDIPVFMASSDGKHVVEKTLAELLPMSFGPENLGAK